MSKAIQGVAELAGAAVMGLGIMLDPALLANPFYLKAMGALVMAGIATEAGALAQALGSNQGMGVTTRTPAGLRQIVRGTQRVGGTIVYCSTTGSSHRQYNMVIVLASHECEAIENLYLDGRQVFWNPSSAYNQTVGGCNFGGDADGGEHIGPNGAKYNFGGKVFCAGFYGNQNSDPTVVNGVWVGPGSKAGFCSALEANDGTWTPANINKAAEGTAFANGGTVTGVNVTFGGSGYVGPTINFTVSDRGGTGMGAYGTATVSNGQVVNPILTNGGRDYVDPVVLFDGPPMSQGTPYLAGCTYVYLKLEADSATFPQFPEIKFTVRGKKDIWDPRTQTRGYTTNWALHVADVITDPTWGLGDDSVNQAQLIAAANVCDELVPCAGGAEARYAFNWHCDTGTSPGDTLQQMMGAAAGRISRVGGEWYIWPAYWQGPSFSFDENALIDTVQWSPKRATADLFNRVTGTYTAANYPYNVAGNLYDSNGYWQGQMQNNFPFSFQPSNFPQYAADALHGYGEDVFLIADTPNIGPWSNVATYNDSDVVIFNGVPWQALQAVPAGVAPGTDPDYWAETGNYLPHELSLPGVLSVSQAQRVAKIALLRNRQQGSGTLTMSLAALDVMPLDVIELDFSPFGWAGKVLEVAAPSDWCFKLLNGRVPNSAGGEDDAPALYVQLRVQETDPSVYDWAATEELTPYDIPVISGGVEQFTVNPPTNVDITYDASTALVLSDGSSIARALVEWTPPLDTYVNNGGSIQLQYRFYNTVQNTGGRLALDEVTIGGNTTWATEWCDFGTLSGQSSFCFIDIASGYSGLGVRLRSVRSSGAMSDWVYDSATINGVPTPIVKPQPIMPIVPIGGSGVAFRFPSGHYLDALEPAQAGADKTSLNTAQDTSNVNGVPAATVLDSIVAAQAAATTAGIAAVSSLPALPDASWPNGKIVWNSTDKRLYRNDNGAWAVVTIDGSTLVAQSIVADDIVTGTLDGSLVNVTNLNAGNITTGDLTADRIIFEPGGEILDGEALAEIGADCTANHIGASGAVFPATQLTLGLQPDSSVINPITLTTATLNVQSTEDVFLLFGGLFVSGGYVDWQVRIVLDGVTTVFSIVPGQASIPIPISTTLTGLSAGVHTLALQVFCNNPDTETFHVAANTGSLTVLQIIGTGAGFNFAPIATGGTTKPKPVLG